NHPIETFMLPKGAAAAQCKVALSSRKSLQRLHDGREHGRVASRVEQTVSLRSGVEQTVSLRFGIAQTVSLRVAPDVPRGFRSSSNAPPVRFPSNRQASFRELPGGCFREKRGKYRVNVIGHDRKSIQSVASAVAMQQGLANDFGDF